MKGLLIVLAMVFSVTASAKVLSSDKQLRECLVKAYSDSTSEQKIVNANAKSCRDAVKEIKRNERVAIKKGKLLEKIAKAQEDLKNI